MKKLFRPYLAAFLLGSLLFTTACGDDDDDPEPEPINEEEQITSMTVTFEPTTGKGSPVEVTYTANGGGETLLLAPNTVYTAKVSFNDKIEDEIRAEGDDHEIFYVPKDLGNNLTISNRDLDSKGRALGLQATVTTVNADNEGSLQIILKHQPGLKSATSDPTKGETDVDATFPVIIR